MKFSVKEFKAVASFAASDESRPVLAGVAVIGGNMLCAADGFVLATLDVESEEGDGIEETFIVAPKPFLAIASGYKATRASLRMGEDGAIVAGFWNSKNKLVGGIKVDLIEGRFPDLESVRKSVADSKKEYKVALSARYLKRMAEAAIAVNPDNAAVRFLTSGKNLGVVFETTATSGSIVMEALDDDGAEITGVIMPMIIGSL